MTVPCNSSGVDFSIPADAFQIANGGWLIFKIRNATGTIDLNIGGSNSYFTSPSGSDLYYSGPTPTLYTLTTSATNGTVAVNPGQPAGGYPAGTTVTLTPIPESGYMFAGWSDGQWFSNPLIVMMDSIRPLPLILWKKVLRVGVEGGGFGGPITIDGSFDDWANVPVVSGGEAAGDATDATDITAVYFAYDDTNIFARIDANTDNITRPIHIGIDSDKNQSTGYDTETDSSNIFTAFHMLGIDYMAVIMPMPANPQEPVATLYHITGPGWNPGPPSNLSMDYSYDSGVFSVEMAIPIASMGSIPWKMIAWSNNPPEQAAIDETPNCGFMTFPQFPDLTITDIQGNWVDEGAGTYTITCSVSNTGMFSIVDFDVDLSIDNTSGENQTITTSLDPSTSTNIVFDNFGANFTLSDVYHLITIIADSKGNFTESDETNNTGYYIWPDDLPLNVETVEVTDVTAHTAHFYGLLSGKGAETGVNVYFGFATQDYYNDHAENLESGPWQYGTTQERKSTLGPYDQVVLDLEPDTDYVFAAITYDDNNTQVEGTTTTFHTDQCSDGPNLENRGVSSTGDDGDGKCYAEVKGSLLDLQNSTPGNVDSINVEYWKTGVTEPTWTGPVTWSRALPLAGSQSLHSYIS